MKIEKLKEKARKHEQREEWRKAMDLYAQALHRADERDDVDIGLHNRLGDLRIRVGDLDGAVESYEMAIDLYLEADLASNALAVCRKLERSAPDRPGVMLRMGQIRVRQGFVVDARQDFLNYAERQLALGDSDEALRALEEFSALAPDDAEIRLFLAGHLHNADRQDDAVEYLREAYRILVRQGSEEQAEEVRLQVEELDPDVDLDADCPGADEVSQLEGPEPFEEGLAGFETTSLSEIELSEPPRTEVEEPPEETSTEPLVDSRVDEEALTDSEDQGLEALEGTVFNLDDPVEAEADASLTEADDGEREDVLEEVTFDLDEDDQVDEGTSEDEVLETHSAVPESALDDLPLLDDPPVENESDPDESGAGEGAVAGDALGDLPPLEEASGGREEAPSPELEPVGELDDLGLDPVGLGSADLDGLSEHDSIQELQAKIEADPGDADAWRALGGALLEAGREEHALEALERAHRAYGQAGDPERAMRVLRELIFHDPEEIRYYQRLVEYAHMTRDRALMVPAFLELAEALSRNGENVKAEAVYGRVLSLDPRNPRARAALARETPAEQAASSARGFVNLGGMVLDEPKEDSFRWKVADAEPTGDEEADFARMLSQFKEKVARNLPSTDAQAHYDLGAAYKEMGLLEEAVGQFQRAIRAHPSHLAAYEMVGQCFLEKEEPEIAVRTLGRALEVEYEVEEDLLGIYYYLGQAHEEVGNSDSAREFYERVFSLDINFMDVTERLRALR
jgi:tetratricopeptide (TPR) repeat protein